MGCDANLYLSLQSDLLQSPLEWRRPAAAEKLSWEVHKEAVKWECGGHLTHACRVCAARGSFISREENGTTLSVRKEEMGKMPAGTARLPQHPGSRQEVSLEVQ